MADDKRTKVGATGPVRPITGPSASAPTTFLPETNTPAAATGTPAPSTVPSAGGSTSYLPDRGDPLLGATMAGRYLIEKKLGEGGMGAVYLATHTLLDKKVALKVLHGEFARKADLVERFMQEAKAASRIRHENVIDISDFGTTDEGLVFFAMELLKGHDLHEEVARARLNDQLLPWTRSKRIFLQICSALSAAHAHGIIHRDLKPENVYLVEFLGEPDFVKLLDFGIAKQTEVEDGGRKLTKTGMLFGTPEYMSPEQARGEQVDHRVDVYAMGCILFQLVTARVPFEADNFMGVLTLHLTEPPPQITPDVFDRIGAPRELAGVIERALQKDRNARWGTIDELAHAVRAVCGDPLPGGSQATATQRAPSVPAPANTTTSRVRTQWTGNVAVPPPDAAPVPSGKSKLPLVLGAIVLLGAGGAAAYFATRGDGGASTAGSGSVGSVLVAGSGQAPVPADAAIVLTPDAPELPPLTGKVRITIDSKPRGARLKEVGGRNREFPGKTPVTLDIAASREAITFALTLKGHRDAIIEVTPDHAFNEVVQMEKGEGAATPVRVGGSGTPQIKPPNTGSGAVTTPDAGSATVKPPESTGSAKPPENTGSAKPPPNDPCPDPDPDVPCLKSPFPAGGGGN